MSRPSPHSEVGNSRERPLLITLISLWWFVAVPIGGLLAGAEVARVLSTPGASATLRSQYIATVPYLAVLGLGVVCMVGLWHMKKWGVVGLCVLFLLGQLIAVTSNAWSIGGFLAWIVALITGLVHYRKMT